MFHLRLSRATVTLFVLTVLALIVLLLTSVQMAGAGQDPPPKKKPEEKKQAGIPLEIKGQLQENDANDPARDQPCKTYMVKLKKGKTYVIDMASNDFDAYLRLESAAGNQVAEDDDSGVGETGLDAQIVYAPEADGEFKVVATRFAEGTGKFTLSVRELSYKTGPAKTVAKGELKVADKLTRQDPQDPLGRRAPHKVFSIKMVAGRTYTIDMSSDTFDTFLRLLDSEFRKLAEDDDSGGGTNGTDSRIVFMPKTDGTYHIVATSFDGDVGDFRLTIREEK